jgi:hypothetical protein
LLWTHRPWKWFVTIFFIPRLTTPKFDIPPLWFLELSVEPRGIKKNLNKPLWWTYNIS